jgi:hypothetical protein
MIENRKLWTRRQDRLRKLLGVKAYFGDAIQLFLQQHAAVHTAAVSAGRNCFEIGPQFKIPEDEVLSETGVNPARTWFLQDEVLEGASEDLIRTCPRPGENSIAWLIWHITRIEDMTINELVLGQPQVIAGADWEARLGLASRDVGAGMEAREVAAMSSAVSVASLIDYRAAVGCSTRAGAERFSAAQLKEIVDAGQVQALREDGSISAKGAWLGDYYTNRPKGFFLTRTATSHNFIHMLEAGRVRAKLERSRR